MIKKFSFGKVFRTESVPVSLEAQSGPMPFVAVDEQEMSFTYRMDPQDVVYGLGENVRGINKRGWIYESKCSDEPRHSSMSVSVAMEGEARLRSTWEMKPLLSSQRSASSSCVRPRWSRSCRSFSPISMIDLLTGFLNAKARG